MQELVGRLTALDPEASETLKVVAYFDVLVAGGVGLQALLRGAAVLSGTVAGAFDGRRTHRIGPDGNRLSNEVPGGMPGVAAPAGAGPEGTESADTGAGRAARHTAEGRQQWPTRTINDGRVWLEREGPPHANDEMVIERLALAVDLVAARGPGRPGSALEIAIDAARDAEERRVALSRLRLDPARETRVAALPLSRDPGTALSTVVATPHGLVRAVVLARGETVSGPAGIGVARRSDELPESFRTALLALRLLPAADATADAGRGNPAGNRTAVAGAQGARTGVASPGGVRTGVASPGAVSARGAGSAVVDAAELGIVLTAVSALEPVAAQQPDVVALARLDARARAVLDELAAAESVRAAATALGMHHSTLQARHEALTTELGYDPRSLNGRTRFRLASLLLRLVENH